jgi:hypothetical protein
LPILKIVAFPGRFLGPSQTLKAQKISTVLPGRRLAEVVVLRVKGTRVGTRESVFPRVGPPSAPSLPPNANGAAAAADHLLLDGVLLLVVHVLCDHAEVDIAGLAYVWSSHWRASLFALRRYASVHYLVWEPDAITALGVAALVPSSDYGVQSGRGVGSPVGHFHVETLKMSIGQVGWHVLCEKVGRVLLAKNFLVGDSPGDSNLLHPEALRSQVAYFANAGALSYAKRGGAIAV